MNQLTFRKTTSSPDSDYVLCDDQGKKLALVISINGDEDFFYNLVRTIVDNHNAYDPLVKLLNDIKRRDTYKETTGTFHKIVHDFMDKIGIQQ